MAQAQLTDVLARGIDRSRVERGRRLTDWLVYGAGRTGHKWATALAAAGHKVHGFIDRQAPSTADQPVYRMTECPADLQRKCAVLVGLHNPGVDVGTVRRELREIGFVEVWLLQDLIDAWPELAHFWLTPASEMLPYADDIQRAHDALADDASRSLLATLLDQRLNSAVDTMPRPESETHYLPRGLPFPRSPMRYIDCGAYTGDSIASLQRNGVEFAEIAAFEPDPTHFPRLCTSLGTLRAAAFPCGVWDGMTQLRFSSDDAASHITASGDITVQTVSLDQALPNFAPTLIKMDIEGAEGNALRGARQTIHAHRPSLAISSYHKPRDLWELMLLVLGWDLDYDFYLRMHSHNGFDTVLYGVPR